MQITLNYGFANKSLKAKIELQLGKYEIAETSFNKVLKIKPLISSKLDLANCVHLMGRHKSALKMYEKIAKKHPEYASTILIRKIECLISMKDYQEAISLIQHSTEFKNADPKLIALSGKLYGLLGDVDASKHFYATLIKGDYQDKIKLQAFFDQAELLLSKHLFRGFVNLVEDFEALSIAPKGLSQVTQYNRLKEIKAALLLLKNNSINNAKEILTKILKAITDRNNTFKPLGEIVAYINTLSKNFDEAEAIYAGISQYHTLSQKSKVNRKLNNIIRSLQARDYVHAFNSLDDADLDVKKSSTIRLLVEIRNIIQEKDKIDKIMEKHRGVTHNIDRESIDDITINFFSSLQAVEDLYKETQIPEALIVMIIFQIILGLHNEAISKLNELKSYYSDDHILPTLKGLVYYLDEDYKKAMAEFSMADKIVQSQGIADFDLLKLSAYNMLKCDHYLTAKTLVEAKYYLFRNDASYRELLGDYETSDKNYKEAENNYAVAFQLNPHDFNLATKILNVYFQQGELLGVKKVFKSLNEKSSNEFYKKDLLVTDAFLSLRQGEHTQSLEIISRAMLVAQRSDCLFTEDMLFNLLGIIQFFNNNFEDSYKSFCKARDLIKKNRYLVYSRIEFDDANDSNINTDVVKSNTGTTEVDGLVTMIDFNTVVASLFNTDRMEFFDELEFIEDYELKRRLLKLHEERRKSSQILHKKSKLSKVFKDDDFFGNTDQINSDPTDIDSNNKETSNTANKQIVESKVFKDPLEVEAQEGVSNRYSKDTKFFFDEESENEEDIVNNGVEKSQIYDQPLAHASKNNDKFKVIDVPIKIDISGKELSIHFAFHLPKLNFEIKEPCISELFTNVLNQGDMLIKPLFPSEDDFEIFESKQQQLTQPKKQTERIYNKDALPKTQARAKNTKFPKKRLKKLTKSFN